MLKSIFGNIAQIALMAKRHEMIFEKYVSEWNSVH
jgi:hypothetical protein